MIDAHNCDLKWHKCTQFRKKLQEHCHDSKASSSKDGEKYSNDKFSCKQCGNNYKSLDDLIEHESSHTDGSHLSDKGETNGDKNEFNGRKLKHFCEQCGKGFTYLCELKYHKLRHAGVTYSCDICQKCFCQRMVGVCTRNCTLVYAHMVVLNALRLLAHRAI